MQEPPNLLQLNQILSLLKRDNSDAVTNSKKTQLYQDTISLPKVQ